MLYASSTEEVIFRHTRWGGTYNIAACVITSTLKTK